LDWIGVAELFHSELHWLDTPYSNQIAAIFAPPFSVSVPSTYGIA